MRQHHNRSPVGLICALLLLPLGLAAITLGRAPAPAHAQAKDQKLTLRAIMSELGSEYLRLTNALLIDDVKGLEQSAKAIHDHPLPDEIVTAIKAKLGRDFRSFERIDEQSHQAAADIAKRAAAIDLTGSAKAFGRLAESCVACHKQFRVTLRPMSDR